MAQKHSVLTAIFAVTGLVFSIAPRAEAEETRGSRFEGAADIHGEFTMGFLTGGRRYSNESFSYAGGGGGLDGVGALVEPFEGAPFSSVLANGLRYDVRLVVSYVRMTVGVDIPFPHYQTRDTHHIYDVAGQMREVSVQDVSPYVLRFGIGGEYQFGIVAPFIDVLGTVHWVDATLSVDGNQVEYEASSFGFAIRGGLRVHVRRWFFISASGEVGLVGDVFWGAELSVGFAVG